MRYFHSIILWLLALGTVFWHAATAQEAPPPPLILPSSALDDNVTHIPPPPPIPGTQPVAEAAQAMQESPTAAASSPAQQEDALAKMAEEAGRMALDSANSGLNALRDAAPEHLKNSVPSLPDAIPDSSQLQPPKLPSQIEEERRAAEELRRQQELAKRRPEDIQVQRNMTEEEREAELNKLLQEAFGSTAEIAPEITPEKEKKPEISERFSGQIEFQDVPEDAVNAVEDEVGKAVAAENAKEAKKKNTAGSTGSQRDRLLSKRKNDSSAQSPEARNKLLRAREKTLKDQRAKHNYKTQIPSRKITKKEYDKQNRHLPKLVTEADLDYYLFLAAARNNLDGVRAMLDAGKNPNIMTKNGDTPLMAALSAGNNEVAELLILRGADVTMENKNGNTALHIASHTGRAQLVPSLIQANAEVDATNIYGDTSLMAASASENIDIMDLLIEAGADVNRQNNSGHTALHVAAFEGKANAIAKLMEEGASSLPDQRGQTPAQLAMNRGFTQLAQQLDPTLQATPASPYPYAQSGAPQNATPFPPAISTPMPPALPGDFPRVPTANNSNPNLGNQTLSEQRQDLAELALQKARETTRPQPPLPQTPPAMPAITPPPPRPMPPATMAPPPIPMMAPQPGSATPPPPDLQTQNIASRQRPNLPLSMQPGMPEPIVTPQRSQKPPAFIPPAPPPPAMPPYLRPSPETPPSAGLTREEILKQAEAVKRGDAPSVIRKDIPPISPLPDAQPPRTMAVSPPPVLKFAPQETPLPNASMPPAMLPAPDAPLPWQQATPAPRRIIPPAAPPAAMADDGRKAQELSELLKRWQAVDAQFSQLSVEEKMQVNLLRRDLVSKINPLDPRAEYYHEINQLPPQTISGILGSMRKWESFEQMHGLTKPAKNSNPKPRVTRPTAPAVPISKPALIAPEDISRRPAITPPPPMRAPLSSLEDEIKATAPPQPAVEKAPANKPAPVEPNIETAPIAAPPVTPAPPPSSQNDTSSRPAEALALPDIEETPQTELQIAPAQKVPLSIPLSNFPATPAEEGASGMEQAPEPANDIDNKTSAPALPALPEPPVIPLQQTPPAPPPVPLEMPATPPASATGALEAELGEVFATDKVETSPPATLPPASAAAPVAVPLNAPLNTPSAPGIAPPPAGLLAPPKNAPPPPMALPSLPSEPEAAPLPLPTLNEDGSRGASPLSPPPLPLP